MKLSFKNTLFILMGCLLIFTFQSLKSQPKRYAIFKAGFGLPYGAYGLNMEYRYFNIGGYIGAGYMKTQYYRDISIPSSVNGALGLKYYFFRNDEPWHPMLGIHAGWLNNYYHKDIGKTSYRATVNGLAFIAGIELTEDIASLEMSMMIDPGLVILKPEMHPSYLGKVYFSPSIGVGVNIYAIRYYFKHHERKRSIEEKKDAGVISEKIDNLKSKNESVLNKESEVLSKKIEAECNDTISFPAVRTLVTDNQSRLLAGKQIAEDVFLFVRFEKNSKNGKVQLFQLDSSNVSVKVFAVKNTGQKTDLYKMANIIASDKILEGDVYDLFKGSVMIYYYGNVQNEISLKLNDLRLVRKTATGDAELYYDEIFICLVAEKNK